MTNEFTIRPAADGDRRACRMLLPQLSTVDRDLRATVATVGSPPRVVAAAATGDASLAVDGHLPVGISVAPPYRRRGVGRALADRLAADAAGVAGLFVLQWLDPDGEPMAALRQMGFAPWRRRHEYQGRIRDGLPTLAPLFAGLVERAWIPATASIVSLRQADLGAVADLHLRYLGGNRADLMSSLGGGPPGHFDGASFVLLLDGRVIGFTLGRVDWANKVCDVDSTVVDPSLRLGWANLWLRYHAGVRLLEDGVEWIRYRALDQHTDTRRAFRRTGMKLTATTVLAARPVGPGPTRPG